MNVTQLQEKSAPARHASPTLIGALRQHANAKPAVTALGFEGDDESYATLTWGELYKKALQFGAFIKASGAEPGDRIVILTPSVSHQILAFLGAIACRCVPTIVSYPSNKQSPEAFMNMLTPILENCRPRLLLSEESFSDYLKDSEFDSILRSLPAEQELPAPMDGPEEGADEVLFLQFSSGTTGARKAVAVTPDMFAAQSASYADALGLTDKDNVVSWLPLYHDMGLLAAFLMPIHLGIPAVHQSPFDWLTRPERLFELIEKQRATFVWLPNFAYELLTKRVDPATVGDLGSIRGFINCSEPVREETHARFFAAFGRCGLRQDALLTCYAMAETTFAVTQSPPGVAPRIDRISRAALYRESAAQPVDANHDETDTHLALSSGRPVAGTRIRIAGTTADRQLGEIEVYSPSLFDGYLYHPAPRESFCKDGWFKTGDIGYTVGNELFVTGRSKDIIIRRGHNLFSADIEITLAEVAGCKPGRIVAFGVDDERSGTERLVIMVERAGDPVDDRQLTSAIRGLLLDRMNETVDEVVICEQNTLLKSTSGKLSRGANKKKYLAEKVVSQREEVSSQDIDDDDQSIEAGLERIWCSILNLPQIGPDARLFSELGLDSIGSMQGIGEIQKKFGRNIDASKILTLDTIEKQARAIRSDEDHTASDGILLCLQQGDERNPLFLVHPAAGRGWPYSNLLAHIPEDRTVFALQSPELFEGGPLLSVEEMAERYLDEIERIAPTGPLMIAGWSFGGAIAHTMACMAQVRQREIAKLIFFDTDPPQSKAQKIAHRMREELARKVAVKASSKIIDRLAGIGPSACSRYLRGLDPRKADVGHYMALARYCIESRQGSGHRALSPTSDLAEIADSIFGEIEEFCRIDEYRPFLIPSHDTAQKLLNSRVLVKNRSLAIMYAPIGRFVGDVHIISAENPDRLKGWEPYVDGRVIVTDFQIDGTEALTPHLNMMATENTVKFGDFFGDLISQHHNPEKKGL